MQRRKIAPDADIGTARAAGGRSPGLRDRKRRETRRRLEEAAVALAVSERLEHATIEAISDRAGVSPRTFFNYFDSKEDAVLGIREVTISQDLLAEHRRRYAGVDALESVVGLLAMTTAAGFAGPQHRDARKTLMERYPQLLSRFVGYMTRLSDAVTDAARELLAQDPQWRKAIRVPGVAETVLGLCFGAFRHCLMSQAEDVTDIGAVERDALALVRRTIATAATTPARGARS